MGSQSWGEYAIMIVLHNRFILYDAHAITFQMLFYQATNNMSNKKLTWKGQHFVGAWPYLNSFPCDRYIY